MAPKVMKGMKAMKVIKKLKGSKQQSWPSWHTVHKKCGVVTGSFQHEAVPKGVRKMLTVMAEESLSVCKDQRLPQQVTATQMVGETLRQIDSSMTGAVAELQGKLDGSDAERAGCQNALDAAQAAHDGLAATAKQRNEEKGAAKAALKAAADALAAASAAEKEGNAALDGAAGKKEKLENIQTEHYAPLKEKAGAFDKLAKILEKDFGLDKSLLEHLPGALKKEPSARGTFDVMMMQQLDEAFTEHLNALSATIAEGDAGKVVRANAVAAAQAAQEAAKATYDASVTASDDASKLEHDQVPNLRAARTAVATHMPSVKKAEAALVGAKRDLEAFHAGPAIAFAELLELVAPPPPPPPRKAYYETVDGMKLDRGVIDACRDGMAARGDDRIIMEDAKKIYEEVADGNRVTQVERWTLCYCLSEYNWNSETQDFLVESLKHIKQTGRGQPMKKAKTDGYYETIDGIKCDRGIVDCCRIAVAGHGDSCISVEDAKMIWEKAADANKVTRHERWTLRHCLAEYKWTQEAHDFLNASLKTVREEDVRGVKDSLAQHEEFGAVP